MGRLARLNLCSALGPRSALNRRGLFWRCSHSGRVLIWDGTVLAGMLREICWPKKALGISHPRDLIESQRSCSLRLWQFASRRPAKKPRCGMPTGALVSRRFVTFLDKTAERFSPPNRKGAVYAVYSVRRGGKRERVLSPKFVFAPCGQNLRGETRRESRIHKLPAVPGGGRFGVDETTPAIDNSFRGQFFRYQHNQLFPLRDCT